MKGHRLKSAKEVRTTLKWMTPIPILRLNLNNKTHSQFSNLKIWKSSLQKEKMRVQN